VELRNLTPHVVNIVHADGRVVSLPPSGTVARCEVHRNNVLDVAFEGCGAIPVGRLRYGAADLPEQHPGVMLIVSIVVAQRSDRTDLLVVDGEIRNDEGTIIGASGLARFS
jgi:hypothetical protein